MYIEAILFGLACGMALGLTGGGGSILAVPMLVYGLKFSIHQALGISLLIVGVTAFMGVIPKSRRKDVIYSVGILFAVTGVIFAPLGSYISRELSRNTLLIAFAALMIIIGIWTLIKEAKLQSNLKNKPSACNYLPNNKLDLQFKCQLVIALSGVITGVLTGLFGVGGGFLIVPALLLAAKLPINKAINTSLFIIVLVSTSGFIAHANHLAHFPIELTIYFLIGSLGGILIANYIKTFLNDWWLEKIFATLIILMGLGIFVVEYSIMH